MNHAIRLITLTICLFISIAACSEQSSTSEDKSDPALSGERFFDAAASKFMAANLGLTRTQANCMVSAMTDDGKIGLGEINQMKLDTTSMQGGSSLLNAYRSSMQKCGAK